jgi:hypothetical protein
MRVGLRPRIRDSTRTSYPDRSSTLFQMLIPTIHLERELISLSILRKRRRHIRADLLDLDDFKNVNVRSVTSRELSTA